MESGNLTSLSPNSNNDFWIYWWKDRLVLRNIVQLTRDSRASGSDRNQWQHQDSICLSKNHAAKNISSVWPPLDCVLLLRQRRLVQRCEAATFQKVSCNSWDSVHVQASIQDPCCIQICPAVEADPDKAWGGIQKLKLFSMCNDHCPKFPEAKTRLWGWSQRLQRGPYNFCCLIIIFTWPSCISLKQPFCAGCNNSPRQELYHWNIDVENFVWSVKVELLFLMTQKEDFECGSRGFLKCSGQL